MSFRHTPEGRAPAITFALCCALALAGFDQPPRSQAHADPIAPEVQVPAAYARQQAEVAKPVLHPLPVPVIEAASAIVIDAATGEVLFEQNADELRAPASTTKIMTALLALEKGQPTSTVMVSQQATQAGGSLLHVSAGEILPIRDLIEATMVKSGNDGAAALAEAIGGTEQLFIHLMNTKAAELGMANTWFQNPHGMPIANGGNISTARDL
ncbi:MAG TPA: serine hydrolase, partial [bacterium]|nr:serine hydrolase [bacterium]